MKDERGWQLLRFTLFSLGSLAVLLAIAGATYETVSFQAVRNVYDAAVHNSPIKQFDS